MTPAWFHPYPDHDNPGAPSAELDWETIAEVARPLLAPLVLIAWLAVSAALLL